MNDATDRALLIAELEGDLEALPELLETNTKSMDRIGAGAAEELDYAALGYTLHNLYNLMENSFFRIAKHFGNDIGSEVNFRGVGKDVHLRAVGHLAHHVGQRLIIFQRVNRFQAG